MNKNDLLQKNQKKSEKTGLAIITAFLKLMEEKDFDRISVKALADQAGLSRGTFYLYYDDIYQVMDMIENHLLENMPFPSQEMIGTVFHSDESPTWEWCNNNVWERAWFTYYKENAYPMNPLLGPHGDSAFRSKVLKHLKAAFNVRMDLDGMAKDGIRDYFLEMFPAFFLMTAQEWTTGKKDAFPVDTVLDIVSTLKIGAAYRKYQEGKDRK